ncbi:uncharacterized protein NPIL_188961 [Nephila pilipes]|uniref:Uncharacterized protein n=1 Tax=Nephila pilipes TaxID=299642 RepID=A0A8X6KQC0_NEPPI|nr:uncharacterized protein NPIL_188961 [Nephila pilipes]
MYSPQGSGFPQRGAHRMYSSPMNSSNNSLGLLSGQSSLGLHSAMNSSPGRYSPRNQYSANFSAPDTFLGGFPPSHLSSSASSFGSASISGYSPFNSPQNMYSPRNSSSKWNSPRNTSPLHQQVMRRSLNNSRFSSDNNNSQQSYSSNGDYGPRVKPYSHNKRNNQFKNSEKPYNIRDYVNPSMLEDPWAALKAERENQSMKQEQLDQRRNKC